MNWGAVAGVLVATGSGILAGVCLTKGEAEYAAELRAKNKYDELLEIHKRALDRARDYSINLEGPVETEEELDAPDPKEEIKVGGEMIVETPIDPEYQEAVNPYLDPDTFHPDPNGDWSVQFIEEEDYEDDENGFSKERMEIMMNGDEALFMVDGDAITNWADLVGEHILVEFYKRCPPGADRVLWVRNNARNEDYEVAWNTP